MSLDQKAKQVYEHMTKRLWKVHHV